MQGPFGPLNYFLNSGNAGSRNMSQELGYGPNLICIQPSQKHLREDGGLMC